MGAAYRSSNVGTAVGITNSPASHGGVPTNSTFTATVPAGVVNGDALLMVVMFSGGGGGSVPSFTVPTGWTQTVINSAYIDTVIGIRVYLLVRVANSEPASYAVACSLSSGTDHDNDSSCSFSADVIAVSGADATSPLDVWGAANRNGTSGVSAPSVTTTRDGDLIISGAWGPTFTTTPATAFISNAAGIVNHSETWQTKPTAGATTAQDFAWSGLSAGTAWTIAIFSAQPPATPTMNSGTTTYHTSTAGGTASVTLSATTTDPVGSWYATFTNAGGGVGSSVASGANSTKTNAVSRGSYSVTATATDVGTSLTSASSSAQTVVVWDIPTAPTLGGVLDNVDVDQRLVLTGTSTIPDDTFYTFFEYQLNGGSWTSIGNGSTAASGAASSFTWDTHALPAGLYKVRGTSLCATHGVAGPTTTEAGTFEIEHTTMLLASD